MAAVPRTCVCGREFVARRRDKLTCSPACKKRRQRRRETVLQVWEEIEPLVLREIRDGRLTPEDGIGWLVAPEVMRSMGLAA